MFKENVYVLVKNQQEYDNVKNAFEKLGYNTLWTPYLKNSTGCYIRARSKNKTLHTGDENTFKQFCKGYKEVFLNNNNELTMNASKNVTLTLEDARKLYNSGNENFKVLALSAFTQKELEDTLPKSWEELREIQGYYIDYNSEIEDLKTEDVHESHKNVFKTKKQALSALAMAQLSQLMYIYNDGWEPDWDNNDIYKQCIRRAGENIDIVDFTYSYSFLTFKTKEIAEEFLKNFEELIKQYYML
jgi:hypothetical protein